MFQFGRVDGYAYNDSNNQFRTKEQNKQDTGNEFIPKTASGKVYKKTDILDLEDDAAHINMGGAWRMPTYNYNSSNDQFEGELVELLNNTTHYVVTVNGVKGMMFTSKINRHQLFIPFAGYYNGSFASAETRAFVWSPLVWDNITAYNLICYSNGNAEITFMSFRSYAFSVRGVFKKQE